MYSSFLLVPFIIRIYSLAIPLEKETKNWNNRVEFKEVLQIGRRKE
jgi:hypothetical protein